MRTLLRSRLSVLGALAALAAMAAGLQPARAAEAPAVTGLGRAAARGFDAVATPPPLSPSGLRMDARGVWPLTPRPAVVESFDPPDFEYGAGHRGVDLLGAVGQPVRTALPGEVTYAGPLAGRGVVVVQHGDTRTTYEPVSASVSVGEVLAAGDRIGTLQLGRSHCLPRACLHWGWIRGETYLDPLLLVGAGPVRLLPLWRDLPSGGPAAPLANPYAGRWAVRRAGAPDGRPGGAGQW